MKSEEELRKYRDLEERVENLEMMAHPPVEWETKIKRIRKELDLLHKKLEKYGL
jgi:hypothetical protein